MLLCARRKKPRTEKNRQLAEEVRAEIGLAPVPLTKNESRKRKLELIDEHSKLAKKASEIRKKLDAIDSSKMINLN